MHVKAMNIYSSVFKKKILVQPIVNQMKIFNVTTSKLILVDGTTVNSGRCYK